MRFALLFACATLSAQTPLPPGRGVNFYSIEKEKALGAQLAAEYRRQAREFDAPSVNAYLDELGQRLAAQAPATGFTYTFELADDDQTWIHEAPVFPGGPVFVPASLVLAAADEDELAGMLAHAIAHVATRQQTRRMTRGQIANQATVPLIFMGGWSGYAIRQGNAQAVPLGFLTFQRKNELESDQFAARILASAGYDPQALVRYIERVQPADPPLRHPAAPYPDKDTRLAALQAAIRQLPPVAYSAHPGLDAIQQDVTRLTARPAKTPPRLAR
ncbi:MAG: M48 family metalloprotease [Candidatus Solibacter sp.]|nr:M48 family metalloprotease [Candidatus Solibacter sp.]